MGTQLGHAGDDLIDVVYQHAFGEFQFEISGVCPGVPQSSEDLVSKFGLAELTRADVD